MTHKISPDRIAFPRTMLAYDGADFYAVKCDDQGRLVVDVEVIVAAAVTIADAGDITQGGVADAMVAAGAIGSLSAKIRRLTHDLDALLTELKLKADKTETQPVSAASLPLPSGAATEAKQLPDGHNVTVDNPSIPVTGAFYQGTQPVSVASLPLPSGAATSAKQLADDHNVKVTTLPGGLATSAKQLADGHNVTVDNPSIPVTGTFFQVTQPVSVASLPLPSGAASSAKQDTLEGKIDGFGGLLNQGDNLGGGFAAVSVPTADLTNIYTYTCPANTVAYVIIWGGNLAELNALGTLALVLNGSQTHQMCNYNASKESPVFCYGKITAGQTAIVQGYQSTGVNKWMAGWLNVIEVAT